MTSEELLACDDPRELHTEISRLRALTKSQAEENARLREALWGFDYNPDNEKRGYFCAGCDMEDGERSGHDDWHDEDCRTARAALHQPHPGGDEPEDDEAYARTCEECGTVGDRAYPLFRLCGPCVKKALVRAGAPPEGESK